MGGPSTITFLQDATHILTGEISPVRRASVTVTMSESLLPCAARSSTTIGGPSQASLGASPCDHRQDRVTINTLPDDVLVEIFHSYVIVDSSYWDWDNRMNEWHTLVHVCHRWRSIVFASPRYLNLRIEYRGKRPLSEMLDVWPAFPVAIRRRFNLNPWRNFVGALESEHRDRICQIHLPDIPISDWEIFAATMQKPFPELTSVSISTDETKSTMMSFPDSFLGGSTQLLRELRMGRCSFPGIPKLLLSSKQLVVLSLWEIPDSGYFSPQDLGTALSVLSKLESLYLTFRSPLYPASRPRPPLTRSVLPALILLDFKGVHEYLEDLVAHIEVPFLNSLQIRFFIVPDIFFPQLHRLISHAKSFETCDRATVRTVPFNNAIRFSMCLRTYLLLEIRCGEHLASLAQVCSSTFPFLSNMIQLEIVDDDPPSHWTDDVDTTRWLELLDPFIAVKDLRLSRQVAPHVCRALTKERPTDVLPALQIISLKGVKPLGSVPKYIERLVAARKLSGHPVAVHC
ncbi:hypothetical protein F5148DRAFT_1374366 [Russula earlei]|uniref:Uncharacterized protein n=1 Tax=Russula earlei TaxID=71964 RepID=A0ACC0UFS9_9AGAM|nr:hypothetical protein F5148DRAFT_1374366 [Russula earlei]